MSSQLLEKPITASGLPHNVGVGVYPTHAEAAAAVKILQESGFDMTKLSIVGRDYHTEENVVGYYNAGDRMVAWGKSGAFWGGIWGVLFGSAFFFVPGIGPILLAGPLIAALVGGLEGAFVVGGLGALGGAFASIGIPENTALKYETEVAAGKFVVIAHGTPDQITEARSVLELTAY